MQTIILIKQNNNASARAYFIIQGKCLTCSKMASYLGNTSWLISPKLMKVLVTVILNKLCSLHMPSCTSTHLTVCYFLSEILRRPDDGRNRNVDIVYFFFSRNLQKYHHRLVKSSEKIFYKFCKVLPNMVRWWRKFCFLEPLKCLFRHFVNTSVWKR